MPVPKTGALPLGDTPTLEEVHLRGGRLSITRQNTCQATLETSAPSKRFSRRIAHDLACRGLGTRVNFFVWITNLLAS